MAGHNIKNKGYEVENFIKEIFKKNNMQVSTINDYYDLKIKYKNKEIKLEIKSCNFQILKSRNRIDYGRFDFTNPKNRTLQRSNNIIICFVVIIKNSYEVIGFINSKSLKAKRYVSLKTIMNKKITRLNKFIDKIKK